MTEGPTRRDFLAKTATSLGAMGFFDDDDDDDNCWLGLFCDDSVPTGLTVKHDGQTISEVVTSINFRNFSVSSESDDRELVIEQQDTYGSGVSSGDEGVPPTRWDTTKHPNNPVIRGTPDNSNQFYPPVVARVDGTFYAYAKSYPDIWAKESSDGIDWWNETEVVSTSSSSWDSEKLGNPAYFYDPSADKHYLYYMGKGADNVRSVGLATSDNPMYGWTKHPDNPLLTPSDFDAAIGHQGVNNVTIADKIIRPDGEHVYYGHVSTTGASNRDETHIFCSTGTDWTDINPRNVIFSGLEFPRDGDLVLSPTVARVHDGYVMVFTAGKNEDVIGERQLYSAFGGPYNFTPKSGLVAGVGQSGSWDERRVYGSSLLKEQDGAYETPLSINGKYRLYFAGHDLGIGSGNLGLTGLAEFSGFPSESAMASVSSQYIPLERQDGNAVTFTTTTANNELGIERLLPNDLVAMEVIARFKNTDSASTTHIAMSMYDRQNTKTRTGVGEMTWNGDSVAYERSGVIPLRADEPGRMALEGWVSGSTGELISATVVGYKNAAD